MPKPTPTQEELDRAALGEHVIDKEPDGSEIQNAPPDTDAEPKKKQKQMEPAKPAAGGGYQTRQMPPAPSHPPPLKTGHDE